MSIPAPRGEKNRDRGESDNGVCVTFVGRIFSTAGSGNVSNRVFQNFLREGAEHKIHSFPSSASASSPLENPAAPPMRVGEASIVCHFIACGCSETPPGGPVDAVGNERHRTVAKEDVDAAAVETAGGYR